jgi:diphthamide biosynthesis protein 2
MLASMEAMILTITPPRYYLVQKAMDCGVFGIVVGTLAVANFLGVIQSLQKLIKRAGKRFYTLSMGKLNVPKLANFPEIDMFVLVACPESSLV